MDISSEMIHSLLPVFLVSILGVSATAVGLLEGAAEGVVNIVKIVSGPLSDWLGKRKPLAVAGYGMAALTKPLFPIENSLGVVSAVFKNTISRFDKATLKATGRYSHDIFIEPVQGAVPHCEQAVLLGSKLWSWIGPSGNRQSTGSLAVLMLLPGSNNSAVRPIVGGIARVRLFYGLS